MYCHGGSTHVTVIVRIVLCYITTRKPVERSVYHAQVVVQPLLQRLPQPAARSVHFARRGTLKGGEQGTEWACRDGCPRVVLCGRLQMPMGVHMFVLLLVRAVQALVLPPIDRHCGSAVV